MARVESKKKQQFNEFRFSGLNYKQCSNKYLSMHHISEDENKIALRVGTEHLLKTKFGYAFILDRTHVVFVKDWQVNSNWYGEFIILDKNFFKVVEWGEHEEFNTHYENELSFDYYLNVAKEQEQAVLDSIEGANLVMWKF